MTGYLLSLSLLYTAAAVYDIPSITFEDRDMSIWWQKPVLEELNRISRGCMLELLGIEFTEIGDDYLKGTMPVDSRTRQPYGILHGGASVTLAESLGSMAAALCLDPARQYCVGLSISANHIRSMTSGMVTGIAKPLHLGRTTQVWNIDISADHGKPVSVSRLTMAILDRKDGDASK
jgi:1,4-dihydroxy-2-naphthoyl-CoA hydrolase